MARRSSSRVSILSHLNACPKCKYYVAAPAMCKGKSNSSKEGFWYEKCLNNAPPFTDTCDYFKWRTDIKRGKVTGRGDPKTLCCGEQCKDSDKPSPINVECTFGVCVRCCRHLQPLLATPISCGVGDHRKGVESAVKAKSPEANDPGSARRSQRTKGKKKKCKQDGTDSVSEHVNTEDSDAVEPTPDRAPPKRASYATPTSSAYVERISAIDAEQKLLVEQHATRARQLQAKSHVQTVTLRWWTEDGGEPDVVEIVVDDPSAFHPKDIPQLVEDYRCDQEKFQYYDSKKRVWYTGSKGTAPRNLGKLGEDDLCYRALGVTSGEGMPGPQKKRAAPDDSLAPETPRRPQPPFRDYPITPDSRLRRSLSPAATTPPRSGSSAWLDESGPEGTTTPLHFDESLANVRDPFSALNETLPPIPALFAPQPEVPGACDSSMPGPSYDISSAPFGRHRWPLKYVCDMALGFDLMRALEDAHPPMKTIDAFKAVFQVEYKSSTYSEQERAWRAAGEKPGERDRWIALGRDPRGEWAKFMQRWRPSKKSN
ncbi:hypothetical protein LXA43DRAFT_1062859 [Ganoderma leucocontextum]|nr:hypothetical protein LXA43DRAFT_1062859 [Ganoderma leucocontextum]